VDPDTISYDYLKDIQNLTNTKFELTIGRLEKNNKTLLYFNGRKINKGKKIIDIRMPLVFE